MALASEFSFPCGKTIKNRIVKAAMTENLADHEVNTPNKFHRALYNRWATGGLGMQITGNVMVDSRYRESTGNVCLENADNIFLYEEWSVACKGAGDVLAIVQLSHPGRQCPLSVNSSPIAPSKTGLKFSTGLGAFRPARAMTEEEVDDAIKRFARSASLSKRAGFDGVQIHAAHGYLISQFLSPLTNRRTDQWGGSAEKRRAFLVAVVKAVRKEVGDDFIVGVKLNSADFQKGGFTEEDSLEVLKTLDKLHVDFVEVSGGTYESTAMMQDPAATQSTRQREAFFLEFVEKVRKHVSLPLMLTGGFRTRNGMEDALKSGVDLIGIARPVAVHVSSQQKRTNSKHPHARPPHLISFLAARTKASDQPEFPMGLLDGTIDSAPKYSVHIPLPDSLRFLQKIISPALNNFWHQRQMKLIAKGGEPDMKMGFWKPTLLDPIHYFVATDNPMKVIYGLGLAILVLLLVYVGFRLVIIDPRLKWE